ncbi:MAG TPA: hypothetical protein VM689_17300 [Aliidongia sp.]|nr:hypothetical protein [Aliidongia sp.]
MVWHLPVSAKAFSILIVAVSPFVMHFLLLNPEPGIAVYSLILMQAGLALWLIGTRLQGPYRPAALIGLAGFALAIWFLHRRSGLILASAVPHALVYLGLLAIFGASLLRGREPVVTYLARRIHGSITPSTIRYTRQVTVAWCVFFFLQISGSAILILFAPVAWWSMFVNILNAPLLVLMFAVERLIRPLLLVDAPHESVAEMRDMIVHMKGANPFTRRAGLS